jgi:23S rRNA pseudouridine2457 synthase
VKRNLGLPRGGRALETIRNPSTKVASGATHTLVLFNKPFRVLCQFSGGTPGRPTLADFIDMPDVYPAGRLDYDSEGLLLLTDWGPLQHLIADPRHKLPKTYLVQVEGEPDRKVLERLRRGVRLSDGITLPARARILEAPGLWPRDPPIRFRRQIPTAWLSLTLDEGRNRQVRRMTAAVGLPTLRLVRVRVGPWELGALRPGELQVNKFPNDIRPGDILP